MLKVNPLTVRHVKASSGQHAFQHSFVPLHEFLVFFCLFVCFVLSKVIIGRKAQKKENQMTDLVELTKF